MKHRLECRVPELRAPYIACVKRPPCVLVSRIGIIRVTTVCANHLAHLHWPPWKIIAGRGSNLGFEGLNVLGSQQTRTCKTSFEQRTGTVGSLGCITSGQQNPK